MSTESLRSIYLDAQRYDLAKRRVSYEFLLNVVLKTDAS